MWNLQIECYSMITLNFHTYNNMKIDLSTSFYLNMPMLVDEYKKLLLPL